MNISKIESKLLKEENEDKIDDFAKSLKRLQLLRKKLSQTLEIQIFKSQSRQLEYEIFKEEKIVMEYLESQDKKVIDEKFTNKISQLLMGKMFETN